MAIEAGVAVIPIRPDLSGFEREIEKSQGGLKSKLGSLGKIAAAAGVAVGAGLAAGAVGALKLGASFDDAYDKIRVGTGATGKALKGLEQSFKNVLKTTPTDFGNASTAVADLNTRLGLTGKELELRSRQFLELSRITGTDVSANIKSITRVFGDWSISADKQTDTMNALFRASQATGSGVDELASKVVQFGAPLRQMGFGFEESISLLGKFEKEGVNSELVMGSLRIALGKLAKAGKDPVKAFEAQVKAIQATGDAGKANALALELFGARAGPDMAAAIREGRFDLGELFNTVKFGQETIIDAAEGTADFSEKWQVFKNRVLVGLEPLAMRVFNALGAAMDALSAWWDRNGPAVVAHITAVKDAVLVLVDEAFARIRAWWDNNGAAVIAVATRVRDGLVVAFRAIVDAGRTVIRNWDDIRPKAEALAALIATLLIPHWVKLAVEATVSAAKQAAAWALAQTAAIRHGAVHAAETAMAVAKWLWHAAQATLHAAKVAAAWVVTSTAAVLSGQVTVGQIAAQIAKWALLGVQAMIHAAKVAAAWLISMGPIAAAGLAVAGFVALWVIHWDKVKTVIQAGVRFVVDKLLAMAEWLLKAADKAFGWIPGLGGKLDGAAKAVEGFRDKVNASLGGIKDKEVQVTFRIAREEGIPLHVASQRGDVAGGRTLDRVRRALIPGAYVTSTYRTPAENARAGGSRTSYHLDRSNPAVDIGGSAAVLDRVAARLRGMGGWREFLWRTAGHYDHIHVAHQGGVVSSSWPTVPGLAADERPAILQTGETVVPRGGMQVMPNATIIVNDGVTADMLGRRLAFQLEGALG